MQIGSWVLWINITALQLSMHAGVRCSSQDALVALVLICVAQAWCSAEAVLRVCVHVWLLCTP